VNRGNVTCYLDALLFAMFAKLQGFECMLKNDSSDESQRKLAALLRLWVNMLRSGKLIHVDMVCSPPTPLFPGLLPQVDHSLADTTYTGGSRGLRLERSRAARTARHI
jgi:hypothetical protein